MSKYIIRKLLMLPVVLLAVSFIIFMILRFIPGDPARLMAGQQATQQDVEMMRTKLGLDENIFIQYADFLQNALQGDLGNSMRSSKPVISEIKSRFPNTMALALSSYTIAVSIGIVSGVLAAVFQYSLFDQAVMFMAILGASTANFWLALIAMNFFSVKLGILPLMGSGSWQHLILPSLSLAFYPTALIARMSRSSMLEIIRQDYIRTAKAKGLGAVIVYCKHALRNACIPIITVVGLHFGVLFGGAVVTETVFNWPGIGRLLIDSVRYRDYPLIQGTVLLTVVMVVLVNFLVDIIIVKIDPRIRLD
ncbi:ABC transporter permease [Halanaerobium salsuginis]|uniref:Glutathione transport system permease protein n=1 Tax=Halanaerobium salsuginis TaxID=29563 RepID=A0A1I4KX45_9FIRM|nr:ABC transporter permease [Halanaerobium salsuginis]SFL83089.1 glutathione transport system permease protein [Halanaerobium salsuginis]